MERVKRIAAHVNGGSLTSEPCSAAIPVMESMKTKIAALAGGIDTVWFYVEGTHDVPMKVVRSTFLKDDFRRILPTCQC